MGEYSQSNEADLPNVEFNQGELVEISELPDITPREVRMIKMKYERFQEFKEWGFQIIFLYWNIINM